MRVTQQFKNLCVARGFYLTCNRLPLPAERLCETRMRYAKLVRESDDV